MIRSFVSQLFRSMVYSHAGDWAKKNRKLSRAESSEPGFFDFSRTPYFTPIYEACEMGLYNKIVIVCGSQMGKTEFVLNRVGYRLDTNPAPVMIALPNKDLARRYSRKRVSKMLKNTKTLSDKMNWYLDDNLYDKYISGASLRLSWCTSASQLCSDPFAECHIDELDRCDENVEGEGDPVSLVQARGGTYPDFILVVNSTPTIEKASPIVREFEGCSIRQWWNWICEGCGNAFVPWFKTLEWPEKATKELALVESAVYCSHCRFRHSNDLKEKLNETGKYLPISEKENKGRSIGFWIPGLCSPWKSFGERAFSFLEANESGSQEKIQGVMNTCFGETWKVSGDAPKWEEIFALREQYKILPEKVLCLTAGIDVQKDRIYFVIRAWASGMESWLVSFGEIWGDTEKEKIWQDVYSQILCSRWGEKKMSIRSIFVDSGYREYVVYEFARKYPELVSACKGFPSSSQPLKTNKIEYGKDGSPTKYSIRLWHVDDGYFKEWVHGKIKKGNIWHVNMETNEDYCKHLVAEQLLILPSGKKKWIKVDKRNDYLDCEKMATAAAYALGLYLPVKMEIKKNTIENSGIKIW